MNTKMNDINDNNNQEDITPVEQTIAELVDADQSLLNARLADLSDLTPQQLDLLNDTFKHIEAAMRLQILQRLIQLAEDDVCLNFDSIFKHRLDDEDEEIRHAAIEGLWENEETSLIDTFINMMQNDASVKVQAAAASALGRFAMLAEYRKINAGYTPLLAQALLSLFSENGKDIEVRRRALEAVAPLSLPSVNQAITKAYRSGDILLKTSAIFAMGRNCDPDWLPFLTTELVSADALLRYEAATACGELGEEEAVFQLVELTDDSDIEVQLAAILALGKIGGSEARQHLERCLESGSEAVSEAAAQALHELEVIVEPLSANYIEYGELND